MTNAELVAQLQKFPPDVQVMIFDKLANDQYDVADGAGFYPEFTVSAEPEDDPALLLLTHENKIQEYEHADPIAARVKDYWIRPE